MPPKPDVRRLLKKQQQERKKVSKITHPFAKYDQAGSLVCVVCNSNVKSEAVWQAHLGSQLHRENIQKLKELKQQQQQQQQQLKRRAPSPPPPFSGQQYDNKRMRLDDEQDRQNIELTDEGDSDEEQEDEEMGLPADFFDKQDEEAEEIPEEVEQTPADDEETNTLPSGFFDDAEEEARVQGTLAPEEQAKADLEKDLEMFNDAMMDVTEESKQVQEEDDETSWEERHLDINREQAKFDSRVKNLKQLRQTGQTKMIIDHQQIEEEYEDEDGIKTSLKSSVRQVLKSKPAKQVESMFDDEEESDEESDDDWRAQQL